MGAYNRIDRISEEVKKELSYIIRDLKDPRLKKNVVSVVNVNVTRDMRFAKAYISVLGDDAAKLDAIAALSGAAGFVRKEIGRKIDLRYTPEFSFVLDDSIEYGSHINEVLKNL